MKELLAAIGLSSLPRSNKQDVLRKKKILIELEDKSLRWQELQEIVANLPDGHMIVCYQSDIVGDYVRYEPYV